MPHHLTLTADDTFDLQEGFYVYVLTVEGIEVILSPDDLERPAMAVLMAGGMVLIDASVPAQSETVEVEITVDQRALVARLSYPSQLPDTRA